MASIIERHRESGRPGKAPAELIREQEAEIAALRATVDQLVLDSLMGGLA